MRNTFKIFLVSIFFFNLSFGQSFKEHTVGHPVTISLPDYMNRTTGLNTSALIQFKNTVKDVAGFVIEDNKEEMKLAEMTYSSFNEYYEDFIKDFAKDEEKRKVTKPVTKKTGDISFMESELTYYDKESNLDIYYFIGLVETKTSYYKVLCWSSLANKNKFKADFQKILYSLKD